jgi:ABC-2 type transport system permease protein
MSKADKPTFWSLVITYARSDFLILLRMKTPFAFMFAVPGILAVALGSAIAGADTHGRTMLGLAVMFSFMTVNYAGLALFREFGNGTWVRQAVQQPPRAAFLLGKSIPVAVTGMIQLGVFGGIAIVGYGTPVHGSIAQLIAVALVLITTGCLLGFLLYAISENTSSFQSLAYIFVIATGSVSGCLVPTANLPDLSQAIGYITPQYWALKAVDESTSGGGSWQPTLQAVALLVGMNVLLGALALRMFDYRRQKSDLS